MRHAFLRSFVARAGASAARPSTWRAYSRTRYEPGVHTGMKSTSAAGSGPDEDGLDLDQVTCGARMAR